MAAGRNTLFFETVEHNPHDLPRHMLPKGTAELLEIAVEALRIRAALGKPSADSVGKRLQDAIKRANGTRDHNRLGPVRLAKDLLAQLTRAGR